MSASRQGRGRISDQTAPLIRAILYFEHRQARRTKLIEEFGFELIQKEPQVLLRSIKGQKNPSLSVRTRNKTLRGFTNEGYEPKAFAELRSANIPSKDLFEQTLETLDSASECAFQTLLVLEVEHSSGALPIFDKPTWTGAFRRGRSARHGT